MDIPQIKYVWLINKHITHLEQALEMTQWSRALAALLEGLESISSTLMVT